MRVAIVSRIYRPEPAAASFFLGSVADALGEAEHEVEVLTARPQKHLDPGRPKERVRTFPVKRDANGTVRGYVSYMSFDVPLAFRLLFLKRPDVVFVEPPPTTGMVVRVICAVRRIPYIYDAADIWSDAAGHETDSKLVIGVVRTLERWALKGARAVVAVSSGVLTRVQELGSSRPAIVVGRGADTGSFHVAPGEPQRRFMYAGSYSALQGADVLIDAFADFNRTHPGYTLRFIGNGPARDVLESRAVELGVIDLVEFLAPVSPAELNPQLSTAVASLVTLPPDSGYEYAFPTKTYSSMSCGCPVLFAGVGPVAEFVDMANRHVKAGVAVEYDPAVIAEAMRDLADNPPSPAERLDLAAWVNEHHSMRAVARRVVGIIERACSESNRAQEMS